MDDLATVEDLEKAWRPLTTAEKTRAEYYLGVASRRIRRRWKDVDTRLTSGTLAKEDVTDVAVHMVLGIVDGAPTRGAKSWSQSTGPFSQSVTLEAGRADLITIEGWMEEIFEPSAPAVAPMGSFPPSGRFEGMFEWPEARR